MKDKRDITWNEIETLCRKLAKDIKEKYNPDIIIATDTTPRYSFFQRFSPASIREFIEASQKSRDESLSACDLVITPNLPSGMIRFDKGKEFMEAGREATEKVMPLIKKLIC